MEEPESLNVYQKAFRALLLPYDHPEHACHSECPCHKKESDDEKTSAPARDAVGAGALPNLDIHDPAQCSAELSIDNSESVGLGISQGNEGLSRNDTVANEDRQLEPGNSQCPELAPEVAGDVPGENKLIEHIKPASLRAGGDSAAADSPCSCGSTVFVPVDRIGRMSAEPMSSSVDCLFSPAFKCWHWLECENCPNLRQATRKV